MGRSEVLVVVLCPYCQYQLWRGSSLRGFDLPERCPNCGARLYEEVED